MDITFSKQRRSEGVENDAEKNVMTLKAGRLYSGLPYTHGGSHAMLEPEELPAGTYRCTVTCRLSTGRELTVRDFTFAK